MDTLSPAAQTLMIDLDKIDIPADSRPHSPDKLASLIESLKDGQEQEIGVVKTGDRFELVFGKGRVLGMRALKATQIRARVYETLTEAQKLDLTFSENEEREGANPIYQAYLLEKMIKASGLKQNRFAQSRGKTKGWVANYKSYLKMPEFVLQVFTAVNTSGANLRALKQLKLPELQIQVAKEVKEGVTKPEDVGNRCMEIMGKGGRAAKSEKLIANSSSLLAVSSSLPQEDPLSKVWPLMKLMAGLAAPEYRGNNVWRLDISSRGANVYQPTQGALKQELQNKLAEALVMTGQMLKGACVGFDQETEPLDAPDSPPTPVQPPPKKVSILDELDPETRAMVEEDMKLGRIL